MNMMSYHDHLNTNIIYSSSDIVMQPFFTLADLYPHSDNRSFQFENGRSFTLHIANFGKLIILNVFMLFNIDTF